MRNTEAILEIIPRGGEGAGRGPLVPPVEFPLKEYLRIVLPCPRTASVLPAPLLYYTHTPFLDNINRNANG